MTKGHVDLLRGHFIVDDPRLGRQPTKLIIAEVTHIPVAVFLAGRVARESRSYAKLAMMLSSDFASRFRVSEAPGAGGHGQEHYRCRVAPYE